MKGYLAISLFLSLILLFGCLDDPIGQAMRGWKQAEVGISPSPSQPPADGATGGRSLAITVLSSLSECDLVQAGGTCEIPPGVYNEQLVLRNEVTYFMHPGAVINYSSGNDQMAAITDNKTLINASILGHGQVFAHNHAMGLSISALAGTNLTASLDNVTVYGSGDTAISVARGSLAFRGNVFCLGSGYACVQSSYSGDIFFEGSIDSKLPYGMLAGGNNATIIGNISSTGNSALHCSSGYCNFLGGRLTSSGLFGLENSGGQNYIRNAIVESKRLVQYEGDAISKYGGFVLTIENSTLLAARQDAYSIGSQGIRQKDGVYLIGTVYANRPIESTIPVSGPGRLEMIVEGSSYTCGDVDASGFIDNLDLSYLIDYVFLGQAAPVPEESGDLDGSCFIDMIDIAYTIDHVFFGAPAPTGCGNPACSAIAKSEPTEAEKAQLQQKLDDVGSGIKIS